MKISQNQIKEKTLNDRNYLMGHSDISVTMNTYIHLGLEDACEELHRMEDVERARMEQEKMDGEAQDDSGESMAI